MGRVTEVGEEIGEWLLEGRWKLTTSFCLIQDPYHFFKCWTCPRAELIKPRTAAQWLKIGHSMSQS